MVIKISPSRISTGLSSDKTKGSRFIIVRSADLTIMNLDPFVLSEDSPVDILDGEILMTIVNGEIVYEK